MWRKHSSPKGHFMFMGRLRELQLVGALLLVAAAIGSTGCDADPKAAAGEAVAQASEPIYGPTMWDATDAGTAFAAATVHVVNIDADGGGHSGSGTLVSPTTVLTVRHATCDWATITISFPPNHTYAVARVVAQQPPFDYCAFQTGLTPSDFAVLYLAEPVAPDIIDAGSYPVPYVGADPVNGAAAQAMALPGAVSVAWYQCGFGVDDENGGGAGTRRCGQIVSAQGLHTVWEDTGYAGEGTGLLATANSVGSTFGEGDSGGGIFAVALDATGTPVGAPIHVGLARNTTASTQRWGLDGTLPIYPPGDAGPSTTNKLLMDLDQDNALDFDDNCPPWFCAIPANCANPQQIDTDGDGWGDVCDGCPYTFDRYVGADGGPRDLDLDGVPDSCDTCPLTPNPATYGAACTETNTSCPGAGACYMGSCWAPQSDDQDGDGVGNKCDNCPTVRNPYLTCVVGQGCEGKYTCLPGTWDSARNTYVGGDAGAGSAGHCINQLDDSDGDGLGDPCDNCPYNSNNGVLGFMANSNHDAELAALDAGLDAAPQGDVCDQVPTYIARPVLTTSFGAPAGSTMFTASAGVGVQHWDGGTHDDVATFPADGGAPVPVGFRHCACLDPATGTVPRSACLSNRYCPPSPGEYSSRSSSWHPVTVSDRPAGGDIYEAQPDAGTFLRTFTSTVSVDVQPHTTDFSDNPADGLEPYRIGARENLYWRWAADLDAGNVVGPDGGIDGGPGTVGIFWSYALVTPETASPRDQFFVGTGHSLRSMYAYLTTPTDTLPLQSVLPHPPSACPTFPCQLVIDPELQYVNPDPTAAINLVDRVPSTLVADGTTVALLNGTTTTAIDATAFVTPALASEIVSGAIAFVHPVETAATARLRSNPTLFVSYPRTWTPATTFSRGTMVGGLLASGVAGIRSSDPPGASTGARALYSATTDTAYLVGGIGPSGQPTGQIWSFDLARGWWNLLTFSGPVVGSVAALGLDVPSNRMLVLDTGDPRGWPSPKNRRLIAYDLLARTATPINTWPWLGQVDHATLTSMQDGSFVLLTSAHGTTDAFRFTTSGARIQWLGHTSIAGDLIEEPYLSTSGLVIFVGTRQRRGAETQTVVTLAATDFQSDGHNGPPCF
jgi:hypothetical protein